MSSASELFAQSSSLHRQAAPGDARREPVWTFASLRAHSGLAQMFRYDTGWKFPCRWVSVRPKMTLGVSAVVNSCSDPRATAICRPRTLSSRRKASAHGI